MIINNNDLKQNILTALADKEMLKILNLSMYNSKSVNDIIRESDISYTTVYRKIKWLLDKELLVVDKINLSPEGKNILHFVVSSQALLSDTNKTKLLNSLIK
jgi:DNA-binding transcriptional ArsR family regulator